MQTDNQIPCSTPAIVARNDRLPNEKIRNDPSSLKSFDGADWPTSRLRGDFDPAVGEIAHLGVEGRADEGEAFARAEVLLVVALRLDLGKRRGGLIVGSRTYRSGDSHRITFLYY